jgi:uncharacterized membrane protein YsdA (DUF1294 family)
VPPWLIIIPAVYLVMSLVTFVEYGLDKRAARLGRWRIPERRLHILALAFGWPGAWIAQRAFRHKTMDRRFRIIFWMIIALHAAAWIAILIWRLRSSAA